MFLFVELSSLAGDILFVELSLVSSLAGVIVHLASLLVISFICGLRRLDPTFADAIAY
ncbi:9261_t:CDS:2 [Gigaspora rosea]|nr:9261_t:CDS:2 [Gigaspora rosea]